MRSVTFQANVSLLALALSAQVQAQSTPTASSPAAAPNSATADQGLGEIVVTAQRREENLQNVAIAVTAIDGDTLRSRAVTDISALSRFVPGFDFQMTGNDMRPAMRGVRTGSIDVNADPTIGYFVDGIYQARTSQASIGFIDVERVEVQRGPQGTLYGRNTFGGNITVTTNAPTNDLDYGFFGTIGNYNRLRGEAFVNVPLADGIAVRVAGLVSRADGWVKNDFNEAADLFDDETQFVRGSLKIEPGNGFKGVFRAERARQGGNGNSAFGYKQIGSYYDLGTCQPLFNASVVRVNGRVGNRDNVNDCTTTQAGPAGPAGTGVDLGIPIYKQGDAFRIDTDYQTFRRLRSTQLSADMSYDFGSLTLRSITGYVDFNVRRTSDTDFSASTIGIDNQLTTAKTFTQEVQMLSAAGQTLEYVVGAYYYNDTSRGLFINQQLPITVRSSAITVPVVRPQANGFYDFQRTRTQSLAGYGQLTWRATDQFAVTAGGRYTRDRKNYVTATANSQLPLPVAGQPSPLTLITIDTPPPPESAFGSLPANCGTAGVTAGQVFDSAGRYVGATYCPAIFEEFTGKIGIDYQITARNLVYGSVSTGFRSGGFNSGQAAALSAPTFDPENVRAFEVGSKNRFLDNTLQLNIAAFYNRFSNLQERRQVIVGATTLQTIFNAARARSYGIEVETNWQPTPEFNLGANFSVLNARYTNFKDVPLPFGTSILVSDPAAAATVMNGVTISPAGQRRVFAPGYNCTPTPNTGGPGQPALAFGCDLSGKTVPRSPPWSGSAFASYRFDLGSSGALTPFAAVTFSGGHFEQVFNDPLSKQNAYAKLDLTLTWDYSSKLAVELFGTNVTNEQIQNLTSYGGIPIQANYEPPRMFGLRFTVRN